MDLSLLGILSAAGGGSSSSKKADGNPVVLDGLQGGVPFNEMVVSGKNLLTYPYYNRTKTQNGITFTDNGDGSVTVNGIATDNTPFFIHHQINGNFLNAGNYIISGAPKLSIEHDLSKYPTMFIAAYQNDVIMSSYADYGNGRSITISDDITAVAIYIRIPKAYTAENLVFRPQLELGNTPTEYAPPITGRELTVNVCGKNLIPYPYAETTKTVNGITFTDNGDGTIVVEGTASSDAVFYFANKKDFIPSGNSFYLSGCPVGGSGLSYDIVFVTFDENNTAIDVYNDVGNRKHITVSGNAKTTSVYIRIRSGQTISNLIFRPQLELGDTATEFEPYHGAEYTITPDSNPYTVPIDIIQQDGLNVLSIADDSNPTISVSGNKASEQLGTIFRTLDNKPVLLFDGTIPTSSSAGYAEFTIDREYSMLLIAPVCNSSNVYSMGYGIVIPLSYIEEEEKAFSVDAFTQTSSTSSKAYIKRNGDTIYVRESSTSCDHMTIYGI